MLVRGTACSLPNVTQLPKGGQKLAMPILIPTALWKQSGRWAIAGKEVFRLPDRKGEEFMLAPTHEEVITDLVAHSTRSYRSFPLRLYQIGNAEVIYFIHPILGTKFRDEANPRFGLIRGREFIMKGWGPCSCYLFHTHFRHVHV